MTLLQMTLRRLSELYPGHRIETIPGRPVEPPEPKGMDPGSSLFGECAYVHVYNSAGLRVDARWVKVERDEG